MARPRKADLKFYAVRFAALIPLIIAGLVYFFSPAYGAQLLQRSLQMSNSTPGAVASYVLSFTIPASETLGSIQLELCDNGSLPDDPCNPPAGFDVSGATLSNQSGETGFSILPAGTTANVIVLSRAPTVTAGGAVSYTFTGVTNPSATATFYGRLRTYATADASGTSTDYGGLAMSTAPVINVSTVVPPYLLFCGGIVITGFDCSTTSGNYINFGDLTSATTGSAQSQLVTASNAANGFAIWNYGTTMTSGNNIINAMATRDVSRPGIGQFGLNLVHNVTPDIGVDPQGPGNLAPTANYSLPDWYKFVSGDMLANVSQADDFKKLTVSYIINITKAQPPGVYVTTLTYVCLANF